MSAPVSLRAVIERFPATVKGAFVVRGEDADPHQVALREARVVRVPGNAVRPLAVSAATLDVAPRQDVFVPFEMPIGDLEPGWYGFEVDVDVDGSPGTMPGGRHFSIPWPRSAVRSATVRLPKAVPLRGGGAVTVDRLHSGPDGVTVRFTVDPPQALAVRLFADGGRLDVVDHEVDEGSGRGVARAYPLLKSHGSLRVEFLPRGKASQGGDVTVRL